jgi:hypothetical protein
MNSTRGRPTGPAIEDKRNGIAGSSGIPSFRPDGDARQSPIAVRPYDARPRPQSGT